MSERFDALDLALGEADVAAEERLRTDPEFRAEVERLRGTVARLEALPGETWSPPAPPPLPGAVVARRAHRRSPLARRLASALAEAELGDRVRLTVTGLRPSRPGEFYELWLLNSPDDLVSVGVFRVGADGRATVEFPLGVDPRRYQLLDVSVERDDGDPGHSSRSVLRSS